jgi:IclR family acetate operon transcriptional repressor
VGETVSLFVRRGDVRICLAQVQSHKPIRRVVPVGFTTSLHHGATGEVLLAGLSDRELNEYTENAQLSASEIAELRRKLDNIRLTGFSIASGSWIEDVSGIAAPIFEGNEIIASLSVAGPTYRFTHALLEAWTQSVCDAASQISTVLFASARTRSTSDRLTIG